MTNLETIKAWINGERAGNSNGALWFNQHQGLHSYGELIARIDRRERVFQMPTPNRSSTTTQRHINLARKTLLAEGFKELTP